MNDIQPRGGYGSRPARRGAQSIRDNQVAAAVRISAVDAETDVTSAKIEDITLATGTAMRAVLQICQLQEAMEKVAPAAAGRLALLAEDHTFGMAETLAYLRRDLHRL